MKLYFMNDSRQKKVLLESFYVEDIYDMIESYFESHHVKPRYIKSSFEDGWVITFGSQTEQFLVEDYTQEDMQNALSFIQECIVSNK